MIVCRNVKLGMTLNQHYRFVALDTNNLISDIFWLDSFLCMVDFIVSFDSLVLQEKNNTVINDK